MKKANATRKLDVSILTAKGQLIDQLRSEVVIYSQLINYNDMTEENKKVIDECLELLNNGSEAGVSMNLNFTLSLIR